MSWTKQTKATNTSQGFLEEPGFLVSGFLSSVSGWTDKTKAADSWVSVSGASDSWTSQNIVSDSWIEISSASDNWNKQIKV